MVKTKATAKAKPARKAAIPKPPEWRMSDAATELLGELGGQKYYTLEVSEDRLAAGQELVDRGFASWRDVPNGAPKLHLSKVGLHVVTAQRLGPVGK